MKIEAIVIKYGDPRITIRDDVCGAFDITFAIKFGMVENFANQLREIADKIEGK